MVDPLSSILLPFVKFCCILELVLSNAFFSESCFSFVGVSFYSLECFDRSLFESSFLLFGNTKLSGEVAVSQKLSVLESSHGLDLQFLANRNDKNINIYKNDFEITTTDMVIVVVM